MKRIVQFGAGNIGRSLVAQLFSRAGYEVVFVDALAPLVEAINAAGRYDVVVKDELPPGAPDRIGVDHVSAIHAADAAAVAQAVAGADVLATAVGPAVLPRLAGVLAEGIRRRSKPVSIILCENLRGAAAIMRAKLAEHLPAGFDLAGVGLVETSIGKMVPIMPQAAAGANPLEIWAEAYNQIIADRAAFVGEVPQVPGLVLKDNFAAYVDRKLFIHNLGHAAAAYLGHLAGRQFIPQCMTDEAIRAAARAAMWASAEALIARYPSEFNAANQQQHVDDLLRRFANTALNDSVYRVGRDLYRKLDADDRCVGALRLVRATGGRVEPICRAIAAALLFKARDEAGRMFPADEQFHRELAAKGPKAMLAQVCQLRGPQDDELVTLILSHYENLKAAFHST
jgi:mannitol-1-phosphate 5-dehydrogenase